MDTFRKPLLEMEITLEKVAQDHLQGLFLKQKEKSSRVRNEPVSSRIVHLKKLLDWIFSHREAIKSAVHKDFGKPPLEIDTTEIYPVITEIRHALANINEWASPVKVDAPLTYFGTRSHIRYEPKGVCLLIAPWNFPFNLCVGPLISCLAAGNTAILKPSELTPNTSQLLQQLASDVFDDDLVAVVQGGVETSTYLLGLPFDHIFFTGSPAVGRVVMRAAAEHLASVTLELGGKSPTIVDASANLRDAAKRIAFGKFINNGQTCIAPDYVLVERSIQERFIAELKQSVVGLFGASGTVSESSPSYARIVNERHFDRVNHLLQDALQRGAVLEMTGPVNRSTRFIHPMIISHVAMESSIMEEEIFGPILPIVSFDSLDEVVRMINEKPKPLALYIFSRDKAFREAVLQSTSAGGVCINDCIMQFSHPGLPFGGVNNSGIGKSHGKFGFLAFSNEKPVLAQKSGYATPYLLYPPYRSTMKRIVDLLLRWF